MTRHPAQESKIEIRQSGSDRKSKILLVSLLLAAGVWLVFGQTLHHDFVNYDDQDYVTGNPEVHRGLTLHGFGWAFTHVVSGHWHPLTVLTLMLDSKFYGSWAGGFHLTNLLLHGVTAILLFLILREMTGALWRSAFVAALFAIHPLRAESVAWISERKDVLSGLFFMLTLWAYTRYARNPPSFLRYLLVLFCFALGLMSKPTLVTLPFILLLLDYWPLDRFASHGISPIQNPKFKIQNSQLFLEKLPLFVLSAASCLATLLAVKLTMAPGVESFSSRAANAVVSYAAYIGQAIYPHGMAPFYPFPSRLSFWEVALAALMLILVTAAAWLRRKKEPWLLVGWFWYLGMLVPMIGLISPGGKARADRYTYLSEIGLSIVLAWTAVDVAARRRNGRVALGIAAVAILPALMIAARVQVSYWRDSQTLWTHALACTRDNQVAHNNLGEALLEQGRVGEAVVQFGEALRIYPTFPDAHNNLGDALDKQGKTADAMTQYRETLRLDPRDAKAHNNLGNSLLQLGRIDEAISQIQEALRLDPAYADARYNLGNALFRQGRGDDAITQYREALRIDPGHADAHNNLGNSLLQQGRMEEALAQFREALRIAPAYPDAHYNLGSALLQQGNKEEAIAQYREALRLNPRYAEAHGNLGAALFQSGRFEEAIGHLQKALDLRPSDLPARNNLAWILAAAPQSKLRDGPKAVDLAKQASEAAGGNNPLILRTLAAAYAETGDFPKAVETAQTALQLAESQSNNAVAAALQREIKLYQAGSSYRDPAPPDSPATSTIP